MLAALGAVGCASSPSPSEAPLSGEAQVVAIPSASSGVLVETPASSDPDLERPKKTGWVKERDGSVHRASVTACEPSSPEKHCQGNESRLSCKDDSDCTEKPHGRCSSGFGMAGSYCGCVYACETDAECDPGKVCVCAGTGTLRSKTSVCAEAACVKDADCPEGQCGLSAHDTGCGEAVRLACRSKTDTCKTDADCREGNFGRAHCGVMPTGKGSQVGFRCDSSSCIPGRPLVIEGEAKVAPPMPRVDWTAAVDVDVAALDPREREAALSFYSSLAALEHASIASFSRFSLQLLALGAPAALLREAHAAALDEIEHARFGYAMASALAGEALGPDKLPEALAPLGVGIDSFVAALVFEGCVGETLGAAEAREASRIAAEGALRGALSRIAEDEERHAALAWRTLWWALDTFGEGARLAAEEAFDAAFQHYGVDPADNSGACEALGVSPARAAGALRREVLREVVAPCRLQLAAR